ncbi:MerR family transcriptional regulator [Nocardia tengchongensis]|uniref:MerR family transcriptional regulator n=1 Tax=Nocardia tengchongensis TaxID=2055889 RepID=UPI00367E233F
MTGGAEYTIDALARAADTTVRSVRVYHERGVLPPPQVRGRTGYYGQEHLQRVRTISRLLERGIKLNGIKELLEAWDRGDDLGDILGVADSGPLESAVESGTVAAAELQDRFADVQNGFARVVSAGIFEPVDATTYRVGDPEMANLLDRLAAAGVPNSDILHELERLKTDCERIARRWTGLLHEHASEPYERSDHTPADTAAFAEAVEFFRTAPGRATGSLVNRLIERELGQDTDITEISTHSS